MIEQDVKAVKVRIHGRVQGVGYRAWLFEHMMMECRGVSGWVRNREDGTVEALMTGPSELVDSVLPLLHEGPTHANVTVVDVEDALGLTAEGRFEVKPTV